MDGTDYTCALSTARLDRLRNLWISRVLPGSRHVCKNRECSMTSPAQPSWPLPIIALQRCTGCGLCAELCPNGAVELVGQKAVIARPADCTFCEVCESYCPEGAIGRPFKVVFASPEI